MNDIGKEQRPTNRIVPGPTAPFILAEAGRIAIRPRVFSARRFLGFVGNRQYPSPNHTSPKREQGKRRPSVPRWRRDSGAPDKAGFPTRPGSISESRMSMTRIASASWYDQPAYYDLAFRSETAGKADFIEAACRKYCTANVKDRELIHIDQRPTGAGHVNRAATRIGSPAPPPCAFLARRCSNRHAAQDD